MKRESNLSRTDKKRMRLKRRIRYFLFLSLFILAGSMVFIGLHTRDVSVGTTKSDNENNISKKKQPKRSEETIITISAAGDFTIGTDEKFGYTDSFVAEAEANGYRYFIKGINNLFLEDDLTTVNLETTLTTASEKAVKKFTFKGDPSYAKILELGGIEAVNLANNHIFDYLERGYEDTILSLKNHNISYFGYEHQYITTIKGVKMGALGYEGWNDTPELRIQVEKDIQTLKEQGVQIILVHYHWGVEGQYVPTEAQKSLARYTIDQGADLILGHHPHVIQGIEEYNGKFIVYSLGNFMFGGNRNPSDKDTFVFQQTFHLKNGVLTGKKEINVVPFSISSISERNNYQPTLLVGAEADRVMQKIIDVSNRIDGSEWLVYEKD